MQDCPCSGGPSIFAPGMKMNLRTLFTLMILCGLTVVTRAQVSADSEDCQEVLVDEMEVGGADEEDESELTLYIESAIDLGLWTVNDSIARIPAYDEYCHWDTRNLFSHKEDLSSLVGPVTFKLMHEECDFVFPANGHMTSPFGPRWGRMHSGLDLDLETGDAVYAAFEGMVRISQYHSSYGNVVVIRHANGLETLYAHLSARDVKPGDYVQAGSIIGLGGNTGRSYGSHLHFEVRYLGAPIDPALLLDQGNKKLKDHEFELTADVIENHKKLVTAAPQSVKKYHTVRKGETLSAIARKHRTSVNTLCKLNRIRSTSVIRPGQKLRYR